MQNLKDRPRAPLPYSLLPKVDTFRVVSDDIVDGETMGRACLFNGMGMGGDNLSPHLQWDGFPANTASFAVTCFDPDAPTGSGFWHWVLFDLPGTVTSLPTGAGGGTGLPQGAVHARNDMGIGGYAGAAPPEGDYEHRYVFAVHALDVERLGLDESATPAYVGFNMTFHTLARATIVPVFGR